MAFRACWRKLSSFCREQKDLENVRTPVPVPKADTVREHLDDLRRWDPYFWTVVRHEMKDPSWIEYWGDKPYETYQRRKDRERRTSKRYRYERKMIRTKFNKIFATMTAEEFDECVKNNPFLAEPGFMQKWGDRTPAEYRAYCDARERQAEVEAYVQEEKERKRMEDLMKSAVQEPAADIQDLPPAEIKCSFPNMPDFEFTFIVDYKKDESSAGAPKLSVNVREVKVTPKAKATPTAENEEVTSSEPSIDDVYFEQPKMKSLFSKGLGIFRC